MGLNADVFYFLVGVYFGPRGSRHLAVSYMTPDGAICITMAVVHVWNLNGMWCMCGGLRCAAASPPVLLFGAPDEAVRGPRGLHSRSLVPPADDAPPR